MDLFEELESMATNAIDDHVHEEPSEQEVSRWQTLFGYSFSDALAQTKSQKSDFSQLRVSNDHWNLVRADKEAEGFSREAYDHWILTGSRPTSSQHIKDKPSDTSVARIQASYLILLERILSTPESVQSAANLSELPQVVEGASETGNAIFCTIDGETKQAIETWLSEQKSTFKPTFVRLYKAKKDLAAGSIHPTLGLESTLPHHRLCDFFCFDPSPPQYRGLQYDTESLILQDEYPVWYFFYGTLADPSVLTRLLSLPEGQPPVLVPANVSRGLVKMWAGKYKALVDGESTDHVYGSAYKVISRVHEDSLLIYETENYEVVRCCITMGSQRVQGLTFRFVGSW